MCNTGDPPISIQSVSISGSLMINLLADGSAARRGIEVIISLTPLPLTYKVSVVRTIVGGFSPRIDQKGLPVKLGDFPKFRGENFIGF